VAHLYIVQGSAIRDFGFLKSILQEIQGDAFPAMPFHQLLCDHRLSHVRAAAYQYNHSFLPGYSAMAAIIFAMTGWDLKNGQFSQIIRFLSKIPAKKGQFLQ
jgi:hypothetical protein